MNPDVVTEAREWLGTPYKHQHATKRFGCDCLGLLRGVYRNVVGQEPETPPPYSQGWGETGRVEFMLNAAERHLLPAISRHGLPGDVLVFRMKPGAIAKHCGIVSGYNQMIHADVRHGVVECEIVDFWRSRVAGVFSFG